MELEFKLKDLENIKNEEYEIIIKDLKNDNIKLINSLNFHQNCLTREECQTLMQQIQELEHNLDILSLENNSLKTELAKYTNELSFNSLVFFTHDVHKIRKDVGKIFTVLSDSLNGREISLKDLLGIDEEKNLEPTQQLTVDIQRIKSDINSILNIISDFHADQCSSLACRNQ